MDLQTFLLATVAGLSALIAIQSLLQRERSWHTVMPNIATLIVCAGAWYLVPTICGYVGAVFWLTVFVVPVRLLIQSHRLIQRQEWGKAARMARLAALLHPTGIMRAEAALTEAAGIPDPDKRVAALKALPPGLTGNQRAAVETQIILARRDWAKALDLAASGQLVPINLILRSLGELRRTDEMVRIYALNRDRIPALERPLAHLFLFAFTGRVRETDNLLGKRLADLTAPVRDYWRAIALDASGSARMAEAQYRTLSADPAGGNHVEMARLRLDHPLGRADLSPQSVAVIDKAAEIAERDHHLVSMRWRDTPMTLLFIAANLVVFGIEMWFGNTEDFDILYRLGALEPTALLEQGEWWRLFVAQFLHAGPVHLGANMLTLWLLGRYVERMAGGLDFAIIYLVSGLVSMASVLILMITGYVEQSVLVGASGAIFGLVGAIVTMRLSSWRRSRTSDDRRALINIALVIAVQTVIDLVIPQISFAAHLSGLLAGALTAALLSMVGRPLKG